MALNLGELFFQLGARTDGLNKAEREAKKFAKNTERHFNTASRAAAKLGGAIAAIVTIEAARRATMLADKYNILQQRLKTATKSTGDYIHVSRQVFAISNRNGTALETNVELFQSLARVAPELGATTQEILTLTETVGQLGVIGGSSSEQMKNGLLQFTQGLAAGVLRAEEMNSILENIPEVANRIATGMDMTVGGLRKAVLAGEVLSEDVFEALLKQAPEIAQEFADIPPTIDRSSTALQNSFMQFLGQLDEATGTTEVIAVNIQKAADFFSGDFTEEINNVQEVFAQIADSVELWGDLLQDARLNFDQIQDDASGLGSILWEVLKFTGKAVLELPMNLRAIYHLAAESVGQMLTKGNAVMETLGINFQLTWEYIKQAGASAANFVQLMWAKAADGVIGFFADALSQIAQMVEGLPLIGDKFSGVSALAADLKAMATNEASVAASIAAGNAVRAERIEGLKGELIQIQVNRNAELSASHARILAAVMEREATLQTLADKQTARESEREAERQARAERKAGLEAEIAATQEQQARLGEIRKAEIARQREHEAANGSYEKHREKLQPKIDALVDALSTERELELRNYEEALEQLRIAEEMKIETILPYHELRERLETEHQERMKAIAQKYAEDNGKIQAVGAFLGVDLTKKAGDLTLKQQGQVFKQQIDQAASHSKEFFQIKKALALATALIEAPKAILSSFTFGAELGGPILGGIFAGVAAAATAVQIASIASSQYQGGKAVGGNVFSGGMYKVNEQGPEMLSVGGEDFLMMGSQSGSVTPNHKLGGKGGSNVVVNVYPQSGETARVQSRESQDGTQIDVIIEQIEQKIADGIGRGGSPVSDTMESQYGLNRAAGAVV